MAVAVPAVTVTSMAPLTPLGIAITAGLAVCGALAEMLRRPGQLRRLPTKGRSGAHAARLARQADARRAPQRRRVLVVTLVGLAAAPVAAGFSPLNVAGHGRVGALGVALTSYLAGHVALWGRRLANPDAVRAAVGARAEADTATVLERCAPRAVLHSLLLGAGGDLDHVVVGPCLVALETKYGRGRVSVRDGVVYAGSKALRGDPLAQVRRQASRLTEIVGRPSVPVVVISQGVGQVRVDGVIVCGPREVPAVVAAAPKILSPAGATAARIRLLAADTENRRQAPARRSA